jgi:ABC-type transporter lipoprotein component MlaA
VLASAYDPYAFLRNAYLQHRDFKVRGGPSQSEEEQREQRMLEESGEDQTAPR